MSLKERIEKWEKDFCKRLGYDISPIDDEAKADILKAFVDNLPHKKKWDKKTTNDYAQYSFQGYNECLDDIKEMSGIYKTTKEAKEHIKEL